MQKTRSVMFAALAAVALAGLGGLRSAQAEERAGLLVQLGNQHCPVMQNKAPKEKYFADWKGLRVGLCCGGCLKKFNADPEKVLDESGFEWREAAALVAKAEAATGAEREKLVAELVKKYPLVGEAGPAVAAETAKPPAAAAKEWVVDLGNKKCPVVGDDEVDGKTFTIWNGLRIGHCCADCRGKLLDDPAAVLDKAGIAWRDAAKLAAKIRNAKPAAREALVASARKTFTLVEVDAGPVVDLGNPSCPIMPGEVDGKTFTIWNGLRIGHCCGGCTSRLLADPEAVLDKAKIEWREAAKTVAKARNAQGAEREKLLAELAKRYTVVAE